MSRSPCLFPPRLLSSVSISERTVAALLDGDPLLPGQAILISAPAQVDDAEFVVIIDDRQIQVDSLFAAAADTGLRALIQPQLSSGPHELRVELLRGSEVVAVGTVHVMMASGLVLANFLIYPHPIADETAFTYVLSHDADVTVEVFRSRRATRAATATRSPGCRFSADALG